jgi:hypothetical protein
MDTRHDAAVDEIGKHAPGAYRRQLIRVTDEQNMTITDRTEERVSQLE